MIHPLAILPIILTIGCIALICAVLAIDAMDRRNQALDDLPDGLGHPDEMPGLRARCLDPFHAEESSR